MKSVIGYQNKNLMSGITTKFRGMQEETEEVTEFLSIAAITALALMMILL